jgi:hypothetical protein
VNQALRVLKVFQVKLLILVLLNENFITCQVSTILNETNFVVNKDLTNLVVPKQLTKQDIENNIHNNTVFVYGSLADDVNVLDKNAIYSVSVGALQQIDRQQQLYVSQIKNQEQEIAQVNQRILDLETKLNGLTELLKSNQIQ